MTFTAKDVLDEVIRIGQENPDFVYINQKGYDETQMCGYAGRNVGTTEGQPCIVGQALINLGVDRENLVFTSTGASVEVPKHVSDGATDYATLVKLDSAQNAQDSGIAWGDVVS